MKYSFSEIKDGSPVTLMLHSGNMHMRMDANIVRLVRDDIAIIALQTTVQHVLKFENVKIEVIYITDKGIPYKWNSAKIVFFKNAYVMQVMGEGHRYNRRGTYRVGISRTCQMKTPDGREQRAIVRDLSLTGFSITDRANEYNFAMGYGVTIKFEDLGHCLDLFGKVVRIEEKDDYIIYGFSIVRSCKDLPSYIAAKQRRKRHNLPPSYVLPSPNKN